MVLIRIGAASTKSCAVWGKVPDIYYNGVFINEICPEMHSNEIHELYDRHHKVSPNLNSH